MASASAAVTGLAELLGSVKSLDKLEAAAAWCTEQGADDVADLAGYEDEFAAALALPRIKHEKLLKALKLKRNIEDQLERLLTQLDDIEGLQEELSAEEYASMKQDTLTQLTEFQESLKQMTAGNMSLQSAFEATRQAVRAAISQAFKTPEVIRLFAKKEPAELRKRLANIDRDVKLGKIEFATVSAQAAEILIALKKLGDKLKPSEEAFLAQNKTASMADFEAVGEGGDVGEAALRGVTK